MAGLRARPYGVHQQCFLFPAYVGGASGRQLIPQWKSFLVRGVNFLTLGCWEVTTRHENGDSASWYGGNVVAPPRGLRVVGAFASGGVGSDIDC